VETPTPPVPAPAPRSTVRTVFGFLALALFALHVGVFLTIAGQCLLYPMHRGPRFLPSMLSVFVGTGVLPWWKLGRMLLARTPSRVPMWRAFLSFVASPVVSFIGAILLFQAAIDPLANRREAAFIGDQMAALLADLQREKPAGHLPEDLAPLLDRHFHAPPPWLLRSPGGTGLVGYYRGPDRFAIAVLGTTFHPDQIAIVGYDSRTSRWVFSDAHDESGQLYRTWMEDEGRGLEARTCVYAGEKWTCEPPPPPPAA
jgi:hypothetical protein